MHIVIYRPHNQLNCTTQYIGPFATFGEAYDYLCNLPALGQYSPWVGEPNVANPGVKFIQELVRPACMVVSC